MYGGGLEGVEGVRFPRNDAESFHACLELRVGVGAKHGPQLQLLDARSGTKPSTFGLGVDFWMKVDDAGNQPSTFARRFWY